MARGSQRRINRRAKRRAKRDQKKHERKLQKIRNKAERDALANELGVDQSQMGRKGVEKINEVVGGLGSAVGNALGGGAKKATEGSLAALTPYALAAGALGIGLWVVLK